MFYSNTSLIIPTLTAMLAFVAWGVVANRVKNLCFPMWLVVSIVMAASVPMIYTLFDLYRTLYWSTQEEAFLAVVMKIVLRSLEGLTAVVVYKLLALAYPQRMDACPVEPNSTCHFPRIMNDHCSPNAARSMAR